MGNYKFRLSDMIPNAWFYKLRDNNNKSSSKSQKKRHPPPPSKPQHPPPPPPPLSYSRKSYYFSRQLNSDAGYCISNTKHSSNNRFYFPEPPRKSSKHHKPPRKSKTTTAASSGSGCHCRTTAEYDESPPEFSTSPFDSSPEFRTFENDIIIDVDKESLKYHDSVSELDLPRIVTKHAKFNKKEAKQRTSPTRKFPANSPGGVKLRIHSPKIANRKINQITGGRKSVSSSTTRKGISESFAIMKSSYDPQRDFRESMLEMIVENNIRASKDLEDLLACYLSLNSDEYHHLIIKVFKQIWFDLMENC